MGKGSGSWGAGPGCFLAKARTRRAVRGFGRKAAAPAPSTGPLTARRLALGVAVAAVVTGLESLVLHHRSHGCRPVHAGRPRLSAPRGRPLRSAGSAAGRSGERGPAWCVAAPGGPVGIGSGGLPGLAWIVVVRSGAEFEPTRCITPSPILSTTAR